VKSLDLAATVPPPEHGRGVRGGRHTAAGVGGVRPSVGDDASAAASKAHTAATGLPEVEPQPVAVVLTRQDLESR
jgi:hypothetical protein